MRRRRRRRGLGRCARARSSSARWSGDRYGRGNGGTRDVEAVTDGACRHTRRRRRGWVSWRRGGVSLMEG